LNQDQSRDRDRKNGTLCTLPDQVADKFFTIILVYNEKFEKCQNETTKRFSVGNTKVNILALIS